MAGLPRRCNGSALRSNPRFLDYADRLTIRFARNDRSGALIVVIQARVKGVGQECPTLRLRSGQAPYDFAQGHAPPRAKQEIKRVGLIYVFVPPTLRKPRRVRQP